MTTFLSMFFRILSCILCLFTLSAHAAMPPVTRLNLGEKTQGLLLTDDALPLVTLQLTFLYAGGVSDPAEESGRAALAAGLLMEGCGDDDGQSFRRKLESKAIRMGASASQDHLSVQVKTLKQHLPAALELLRCMLTQPRFDAEAFARKQEETRADLRAAAQDPGWNASRAWSRAAFGNHPYARPLEGTEESLANLTPQAVQQWHQLALAQDRLRLAVVGDVTAQELQPLIRPLLAELPESTALNPPSPAQPVPVNQELILVEQDVPQSVAIFGLPAVKRDAPEFYAAFLLNHILGGGSLTSRLSHAIREEKGLAYSVSSALSPSPLAPLWMGSFATRHEQITQALDELNAVLERTASKGITAEELKHAQDYLTGSFPLEMDTQAERAGYLSRMLIDGLGDDYLTQRNHYLRSVTLQQVNQLAKKMFSARPLLVVAGRPIKPL